MIFTYECIFPKLTVFINTQQEEYLFKDACFFRWWNYAKVSFLTIIYISLYLTNLPASASSTTRAGGSSNASARRAVK